MQQRNAPSLPTSRLGFTCEVHPLAYWKIRCCGLDTCRSARTAHGHVPGLQPCL